MESKIKEKIKNLTSQINEHNYAYYVLDQPYLSDAEYDNLFRELESLEKANPKLVEPLSPTQRVGHPIKSGFQNYNHEIPMLSLSNAINEQEISEFNQRINKWLDQSKTSYVAEPKIDGLGVSLIYENGNLIRALTRGDGFTGEDITHNIKTINAIPMILRGKNYPHFLEIRGEIFMLKSDFARLNEIRSQNDEKLFANARNAAAGSVRQLDPHITAKRKLSIFCYELGASKGLDTNTHWDMLSYLKSIGLPVNPLAKKIDCIDSMISYHRDLEHRRESIPYEIDGSVIKVDNYALRSKLGDRARSPRWAIAAKFKSKNAETQIIDIVLQVGRTGVITPVAKIKEVEISGAIISSATLHNQDEIDKKDIRINDYVIVERSGDVIPKITQVLKGKRPKNTQKFAISDFNWPDPDCKIERIHGEAAYRCINPNCKSRVMGMLEHFCSKNAMNIEGMGPQIVKQLLEADLLESFDDIYRLKYDDLINLERFKDKSAMNLITSINESKKTTFPRFLFALGIPNVGQHISKILDIHCKSSIENLSTLSLEDLENIDGVGLIVAKSIIDFFNVSSNKELIDSCYANGVNINQTIFENSGEFKDIIFVITGSFKNHNRNKIKEILENKGGRVSSSVSSKTNFLIVGDNAGSKLKKAEALNIEVIREAELDKFIN
ncbi:MAG: NAD-dependent DNA ligase LigA [Candidatus Marinimicrobia bacterium]|nr:NAD-dependent DNA ligase LigA [Candidatus Neomarinimicrobiota bacterium]